MAVSFADVFESAVANSVTSWPRATSPSVSSEVIVSTDPDLGGGIVVATGAMWAILTAAPYHSSRRREGSRTSQRRHVSLARVRVSDVAWILRRRRARRDLR